MFFSAPIPCFPVFLLLLPFSFTLYLPDSNPLLAFDDHVRERHLYTESKRQGLFLEISPDGTVRGTPFQTADSVLHLRSVRAGETVIQGVSSSLYLCADENGHLSGQTIYTEDCTFKEKILESGYTLFLSVKHELPVSLTSKRPLEKPIPKFSQFLPVRNVLSTGSAVGEDHGEVHIPYKDLVDLDSDDPFGMRLMESILSPG